MRQYFTNDESLKSEYRNIVYNYESFTFNFTSDLGVFSKDRVDFGSKLLIESYFKNGQKNKKILDVGCGYGLIGISTSIIMESYVDMIDINKRAIHLSNMNIKNLKANAKAFESNIYENIEENYDVVITNPPIRAGKSVYMTILKEAYKHLNNNGELWFVINKDQGAKSTIEVMKGVYDDVNIIKKDKGFFVILCKKR